MGAGCPVTVGGFGAEVVANVEVAVGLAGTDPAGNAGPLVSVCAGDDVARAVLSGAASAGALVVDDPADGSKDPSPGACAKIEGE